MTEQFSIALITACSALLGALICAGASLLGSFISRKVSESGRIDVFCKIAFSISGQRGFGIYRSTRRNGNVLCVPMWIEIGNTTMSSKYIRDFNLIAYRNNDFVAEFIQIQGINIGKDNEQELGNHQSYSFLVEGKSIQRFDTNFILHEASLTANNKNFNTIKARYFDENGKKIEKEIYHQANPIGWSEGAIDYNKEWIAINS